MIQMGASLLSVLPSFRHYRYLLLSSFLYEYPSLAAFKREVSTRAKQLQLFPRRNDEKAHAPRPDNLSKPLSIASHVAD